MVSSQTIPSLNTFSSFKCACLLQVSSASSGDSQLLTRLVQVEEENRELRKGNIVYSKFSFCLPGMYVVKILI